MSFCVGAWNFVPMQIKTKCLGSPDCNGYNGNYVKPLDLIPQAIILLKISVNKLRNSACVFIRVQLLSLILYINL